MTKLIFACGAHVEVPCKPEKLEAITPFVNKDGHPMKRWLKKPEGKMFSCLLACPVKQRDSKRKVIRGWFGDDAENAQGEPCLAVLCKPVMME